MRTLAQIWLPRAISVGLCASPPSSSQIALEHILRYGITDHPANLLIERAALSSNIGLLSTSDAHDNLEERRWILTDVDVPCFLPFTWQGHSYSDCHPDGWCCLDPDCVSTAACLDFSDGIVTSHWRPMPVVRPRDEITSTCVLPTLGGGKFMYNSNDTTVFLLHDARSAWAQTAWESDLTPLLTISQRDGFEMRPRFVWLTYSSDIGEVEFLMRKMRDRLREISSAHEERFFHFVTQPAWHISLGSCWLAHLLHSWSSRSHVLSIVRGNKSLLHSVYARSVKGKWANRLDTTSEETFVSGPLRWFGWACGDAQNDNATNLSGAVALVARGGCSFYSKALRAQQAGVVAIVVVASDDEPFDMGCGPPDPCQEVLRLMAVMVTNTAGEAMLQMLQQDHPRVGGDVAALDVVAQLRMTQRGPLVLGGQRGNGSSTVRAFGYLSSSQAGAPLQDVADEVLGMRYQENLLSQRAGLEKQATLGGNDADVAVLQVMSKQRIAGSATAPWSAASAAMLRDRRFDSLELELSLDCDGHQEQNCGMWDFIVELYLCSPDTTSVAARCSDSNATVGRWITAYRREGRWLNNATAALPLLLEAGARGKDATLHLVSQQEYIASLAFWLRRSRPSSDARKTPTGNPARLPLWKGGDFNISYNRMHPPVLFNVPKATARVILSLLLTGHGWGYDLEDCAEFCNHTHHFRVNAGAEIIVAFPNAGSALGCEARVPEGVVPNQFGTWSLGRAGWCPGMHVNWLAVDVTPWIVHGEVNNVTYHALFDGSDYLAIPAARAQTNGFPAYINLASFLTFYGEEPLSTSSKLGEWITLDGGAVLVYATLLSFVACTHAMRCMLVQGRKRLIPLPGSSYYLLPG